jgi:hypothetical protein
MCWHLDGDVQMVKMAVKLGSHMPQEIVPVSFLLAQHVVEVNSSSGALTQSRNIKVMS